MYSAASFAMFLGVVNGWTGAEFRVYYVLGAVLNVPYLFLGEVYLLAPRRDMANGVLAVLLAATTFAALEGGHGADPFGRPGWGPAAGKGGVRRGKPPHRLAQYYSFPAYFLLLGGLVWSAGGCAGSPTFAGGAGTLWIALGATVVAIGSGVGAGFHIVPLFSVSLAAGIAVMYWGFLEASRPLSV